MLACSALAPDGTPVDGFEWDGAAVTYTGPEPVDASVRLSLPPARLERSGALLRNIGDVAALGIVAEDDVLDLLPGEEREAGEVREPGWNARL